MLFSFIKSGWRLLKHSRWPQNRRQQTLRRLAGVRASICTFSFSAPQRNIATQQNDLKAQSACWSILSSSPSAISKGIAALQSRKGAVIASNVPLLVVLVTPVHANLLNDSEGLIPRLLRQSFRVSEAEHNFDVLAAVVDRIPYPTRSTRAEHDQDRNPVISSTSKGRIEDGSEGVAIAIFDSNAAAPGLWSTRDEHMERETMTIQQRCTLSFVFPNTTVPASPLLDGEERSQPLVFRMLQLPIANTLFHNGKSATLFAQRWVSHQSTESIFEISCVREIFLPNQTVHMSGLFSNESTDLEQTLDLYLIPVTPPRSITAAIGNIIRRISVDDSSGNGVPASEELEKAISNGIMENRIPAQEAGIWALIKPPNYQRLEAQVGDPSNVTYDGVQQAVLSGCQLRKVLSGGGGWGEKQGLLALDPDLDYSVSLQASEASFMDDQDLGSKEIQGLGEIIKPGDTVQFFACKIPQDPQSTISMAPNQASKKTNMGRLMSFGSLPSSMDAMPVTLDNKMDAFSTSDIRITENHFGMLSEQGMSLESAFVETDQRAGESKDLVPRMFEHGHPPYTVTNKSISKTKLDAPYTVFSIRNEIQAVLPKNGSNVKHMKADPPSLDEFLKAVNTMPPHQAVGTTVPRDRGYGLAQRTDHNTTSQLYARDSKVVPMTDLLSSDPPGLRSEAKPSRRSKSRRRTLESNGLSEEQLKLLAQRERTMRKASDEMKTTNKTKPFIRAATGPQIRKHRVHVPELVRRLPSAVRRRVLEEWKSDAGRKTGAGTTEIDSAASIQRNVSKAQTSWSSKQTAEESVTEADQETPRIRFIAKETKQLIPKRGTASTENNIGGVQEHPWSEELVRRQLSPMELRKYTSYSPAEKPRLDKDLTLNQRMYELRRKGLLQKKARTEIGDLIRKDDATPEDSPTYKDTSMLQTEHYRSSGVMPRIARQKAARGLKEHHLPLLNESLHETPQP